jgi:hypothetical protein
MRRGVVMLGLAALAATVLPPPALAAGSGATTRPRHEAPAAREILFTLGDVPCSLIPVPAAEDTAPVGSGACPGVRPGARVVTKVGGCTLNFLFRAPDGTRYIGTAGHCVRAGDIVWPQERVWTRGSGPVAEDSEGHRIGEFAYAVMQNPKDFALIRLDPDVDASPEMCHFGAPRGLFTTDTASPVVLQYYGNAVPNVLPARSAVALGTPNPDHLYAAGVALPGDSGSGVMTADGLAIGVLVTTGLHGFGFKNGPFNTPTPSGPPQADERGVDLGSIGITRLAPQVARASEWLGVPLELVTAG